MKKIILFVMSFSLVSFSVFADESEAYQAAIRSARELANSKSCWRLTRAPGLTSTEFARVRAYCWARQTPEIVQRNSVYQSKVLSGVTDQTPDERHDEELRVQANTRYAWKQEEFTLQLNCRGENTVWVGATTTENITAETPHGTCQCRDGYTILETTPRLVCEHEVQIELVTVADHSRDESAELDEWVQNYWRTHGNAADQ